MGHVTGRGCSSSRVPGGLGVHVTQGVPSHPLYLCNTAERPATACKACCNSITAMSSQGCIGTRGYDMTAPNAAQSSPGNTLSSG
jgi:hypothetical protein